MNLFLVVLGGRSKGCHIEQHDVRWVVGDSIDDTLPELVRQWSGLRRGLHIDSYRTVSRVDGHNVVVQSGRASGALAEATKLWFVNLGAYRSDSMAEQHHFGLVAAPLQHRPKPQRGGDGFRVWSRSTKTICMAWIRIRPSMICCPSAAMVSGTSDLNRQKLVRIQTTDPTGMGID